MPAFDSITNSPSMPCNPLRLNEIIIIF
jgi:hypothetical protein